MCSSQRRSSEPHASQPCAGRIGKGQTPRQSLKAFCERVRDLLGTSDNSRLKSSDFQRCLTWFLSSLGQRDWKTEEEIQKKQVWVIKLYLNCCHLGSPSPYHLLFPFNSPVRQSRDIQQLPWGGFSVWSQPTACVRSDVEGTNPQRDRICKEEPAPALGTHCSTSMAAAGSRIWPGAGTEALWGGHSKGTSWILVASPSVYPSTQ